MPETRIQYVTTTDAVGIAYTDNGQGYPILYMSGMPWNHLSMQWRLEQYRLWYETVFLRRRVVMFDSRGSGMSDRNISEYSIEAFERDIDAVVERTGIDRFCIAAVQASAIIAIDYAHKHPERVSHLYIWDAIADGRGFMSLPQVKAYFSMMEYNWDMFLGSVARAMCGDDAPPETYRKYEEFAREAVNQQDAMRFYFEWLANVDVTPLLPEITQPALIAHHKDNPLPPVDVGRQIATRVPNAEFIVSEGTWRDNQINIPIIDAALDRLLRDNAPPAPPTPASREQARAVGLVTILFTDIEGSTALTQRLGDVRAREVFREHERITRDALQQFGGSEVKSMGDGFMASFVSATQALQCAIAMQRAFAAHNEASDAKLNIRIGLNTGEPIVEEQDLFGTAVITAARIAAQAQGGEVLASNVVRELVAGRGFAFADRGEMVLRGFDDPVRVFELRWRE